MGRFVMVIARESDFGRWGKNAQLSPRGLQRMSWMLGSYPLAYNEVRRVSYCGQAELKAHGTYLAEALGLDAEEAVRTSLVDLERFVNDSMLEYEGTSFLVVRDDGEALQRYLEMWNSRAVFYGRSPWQWEAVARCTALELSHVNRDMNWHNEPAENWDPSRMQRPRPYKPPRDDE